MDRRIRSVLLLIDFAAIFLSGLLATYIRFGTMQMPVAVEIAFRLQFWQLSFLVAVMWLLFLAVEGLYDINRLSWSFTEGTRVLRALALGVVGLIMFTFLIKAPGLSRSWVVMVWLISAVLVTTGRLAVQQALSVMRHRGKMLYRTLIVGDNAEALRIVRVLRRTRAHGLIPVGCVSSSAVADRGCDELSAQDIPCFGDASDLYGVVRTNGIDAVIIASSGFEHDDLARMIAGLRHSRVHTHVSSGLFEVLTRRVFVREVAGVPLITIKRIGFNRAQRILKRAFDVAVAGIMVVLGTPLWVVLAVLIKFTSRGPVFYRQKRLGKNGKVFEMFKFRSMVEDAERIREELVEANEADGPIFKIKDDPRVTRVGRFMRKFSLDEFPQLINVLRGEMSLVGPRPPLPVEAEQYDDYQWRRMEVLPGMTGLWQVSGRSDLSFDEMVRLDLFYIENWSLGFDIALMFRTIPAALLARGAY